MGARRTRSPMAWLLLSLLSVLGVAACGGDSQEVEAARPRLDSDSFDLPAPDRPDYRDLGLEPGEPPPETAIFAWLDRSVATVGEVVELTVAVNHEAAMEVSFPNVGRMNRFEVLATKFVDQEPAPGGRVVTLRRYELQAFVPGDYVVPAIPALVTAPDGRRLRARTENLGLVVVSVIPDQVEPDDLIDIKEPLALESPLGWQPFARGAAGLAVFAAVLTYVVLRRRRRLTPKALPLTPHELALKELGDLDARDFLRQGFYDEHFTELDRIFRTYLAQRYEMPSKARASEEIAAALEDHPYFGEHTYEIAVRFMGETDRVKFGRHEPPPAACETVRSDLLYFIDLTRPVEDDAPPAELEGEA